METNSLPRRWFQEPYVWLLIAIPFSAVVVGGVMLYFAIGTEDGLVVDDYYKRGLEINRVLARDAVARQYEMGAAIAFDSVSEDLHVMLEALPGFEYPASLRLGSYHATHSGRDQEVILRRISDRGYAGALPELVAGRWYLTLWEGEWRLTGSIVWPAESASLTFIAEPAASE